MFPDHTLKDDIYYLNAHIYIKKQEFEKAEEMFQKIITDHIEEIRADNAMFELAELYENQLNQPDKAKDLYERIFMDFSSSTFAVESRKRFRKLRGDEVQ